MDGQHVPDTFRAGSLPFLPALSRRLTALLAAQAALLLWLLLLDSHEFPGLGALYLPLHTAMEVFAVVVAAMIFSIGWHSFNGRLPRSIVVLSSAFFAVGLLDLGHLMSVQGMPAFITPSGVPKGIDFWLAARLASAAALLTAAFLPPGGTVNSRARFLMLAGAALIVALAYWTILYHQDRIPDTFIFGQGLTPFKVGTEYVLIAAYMLAAVLLSMRARHTQARNSIYLMVAAVIMAMSEFCFTLYAQADDVFNFIGHIYKVIAYLFLYRSIFVSAVQEPYQRLYRSEQSLAASENRFRSLMEFAPDAILLIDAQGRIAMMNTRAEAMFGIARQVVIGMTEEALIPKRQEGQPDNEVMCRRSDGVLFPAEVSRGKLRTENGELVISIVRDISERRKAMEEKERLLAILEATPDMIAMIDTNWRVLYLNRAGHAMAGIADSVDVNARPLAAQDYISPWTAAIMREQGIPAAMRDGSWTGETVLRRHDGDNIPVSLALLCHKGADGAPVYWSVIGRDMSERKHFEKVLVDQLTHDTLTGLPNRLRIVEKLREAIAHARLTGSGLAVLFLDIDFFKKINDTFGHTHGDEVLRECVTRLAQALHKGDTLARQSGDEFIILQKNIERRQDAATLAERLLQRIREPFYIEGHEVFLSASLGVTMFPDDEQTEDSLLHKAHVAMNSVKKDRRDSYRFYTPEMDQGIRERLEMESYLRHAVERGELLLYYQPKMSLRSGAMVGMEALVRWRHPTLGMVAPHRFISLAEDSGLIEPIGMWVLKEACAQTVRWQSHGLPALRVAVNLSARQFQLPGLAHRIRLVLNETGLDPACLELEITESTVMHDTEGAITTLRSLKELGVALSIDDFGTGYSSLSYLKRFPIDVLKIDRSFVTDVIHDPNDAAITRAIIALAHSLELKVVAEGVETLEQARFLKANGCDEMQGYYFSRPVPPDELADILRERRTPVIADEPGVCAELEGQDGNAVSRGR